jgi:glycosyltransferase involved in cell wall biosynthesis
MSSLSVVVPCYNEEESLLKFHRRLVDVLDRIDMSSEIVYVNDGSADSTLAIMQSLHVRDPRVSVVDLSRNFGKEIALTAGIDHARGDAVVLIDADLQDPPELIPQLVCAWRDGHDVVYGKRLSRDGETVVKKATAHAFYRLMQRLSNVRIPEDTGDFRLLSRRVVDALRQVREQHRFMKGLFAWVGFSQHAIPYHREARVAGRTKWNYWRLWNLALEGITSFSTAPLKLSTYFGLTVAGVAFVYGAWIILKTLLWGDPVRGYPTLMVVILFLGGTQLFAIGIMGEYVGRMFDESKKRPLYLLNAYMGGRAEVAANPRNVVVHGSLPRASNSAPMVHNERTDPLLGAGAG